jgi:cytochrome c553
VIGSNSLVQVGKMKPIQLLAAALVLLLSAAAEATDPTRAEEIVKGGCFIGHGLECENSSPVFLRLAGQHAGYVARQLADYCSGRGKSSTMQPMVDDLTPADFQALGAYFEARKPQAHKVDDPELAQMGHFVFQRGNPYSGVAACASCHSITGAGNERLPRLSGQHAQYTENQLKAFNKRERTNDNAVMHAIATKLTELELKAASSYIRRLQ